MGEDFQDLVYITKHPHVCVDNERAGDNYLPLYPLTTTRYSYRHLIKHLACILVREKTMCVTLPSGSSSTMANNLYYNKQMMSLYQQMKM